MSQPKRQLLFLCQTLPYPPDGGVWIRTWNVLRQLATRFDVTLLCFERAISRSDGFVFDQEASLETLGSVAETSVFPIPQRDSRLRFAWDHGRSVLRRRVFTEFLYESKPFRRRLDDLLARRRFDIAHVDSIDLGGYLAALRGMPRVLVHHNVESELLHRRSLAHSGPIGRAYIRYQSRLAEAAERHWCPRVDLNVVVSERDAGELRRLAPSAVFEVVPNGVDLDLFRPAASPTDGLVFVGGANWFPNRDGLQFFSDDILPLLQDVAPRVAWVGAAQDRDRVAFAARGISLTGYVDDIRPHVHAARCYIVPLRVGGGSRLKILDAWAMGKAVVSTSVGCEGLAAVDGTNILIADTPSAFADAVRRVLRDDALVARLGAAARATVEREYGWDIVGRRMVQRYDQLLR